MTQLEVGISYNTSGRVCRIMLLFARKLQIPRALCCQDLFGHFRDIIVKIVFANILKRVNLSNVAFFLSFS